MIKQDGEATSDQKHHEKEIEKMAIAYPEREPVRPGEVIRKDLRDGRNRRQSGYCKLDPRGEDGGQDHGSDSDENGRANPNPEASVLGVMHCSVRSIEGNHS